MAAGCQSCQPHQEDGQPQQPHHHRPRDRWAGRETLLPPAVQPTGLVAAPMTAPQRRRTSPRPRGASLSFSDPKMYMCRYVRYIAFEAGRTLHTRANILASKINQSRATKPQLAQNRGNVLAAFASGVLQATPAQRRRSPAPQRKTPRSAGGLGRWRVAQTRRGVQPAAWQSSNGSVFGHA